MDKAGRIVIPRDVRVKAALKPGAPLDIRVNNGVVELEPASATLKKVKKGRWTVLEPVDTGVGTLSQAQVDEVLEELRSGRR